MNSSILVVESSRIPPSNMTSSLRPIATPYLTASLVSVSVPIAIMGVRPVTKNGQSSRQYRNRRVSRSHIFRRFTKASAEMSAMTTRMAGAMRNRGSEKISATAKIPNRLTTFVLASSRWSHVSRSRYRKY